jgi:MSHA biogenesis protein MshP
MNNGHASLAARHKGSALMAALFLIVVVAALGAFAVRLHATQQQVATLQLLEYRAQAAAYVGLEYWSHLVSSGGPLPPCSGLASRVADLDLDDYDGLRGFTVDVFCEQVSIGGAADAYEVTAKSEHGSFGSPDFVRRSLTRHIQTTPPVYD